MRQFDHIGLRTFTRQPEERFVQKTRVWVTDPQKHPFRVEWLRFEDDSPTTDELKNSAHLAFHVDSIEEESRGLTELIAPFHSVADHRVGFYRTPDGAVVELMEY